MRGERRKGRRCCTGARGTRRRVASEAGHREREQILQLCPFHATPALLRREAGGGGEGRVTRHGCLLKRNSSAGSGG